MKNRQPLSFGLWITLINVALTVGLLFVHAFKEAPLWRIVFIFLVVTERIYETFFTSREQSRDKLQGDWALFTIVISYLIVFQGSFYEYYFVQRPANVSQITIGFLLFSFSLFFRWWAILSLKNQWGIHSIEQARIGNVREVVRSGPYRYLRHPYYFAVCIEIISIPLIMGSYWSLALAVLVVCPVEIIRGYLEERHLVETFGWPYLKYQHERAGFFPIKKMDAYDRRTISSEIQFMDRRTSQA